MEEQLINILKEMNEKIKDIVEKIFLLQREPKVEHFYSKSKDGKYIIHSTKLVDIKPISYIEKVLTPQETNALNDLNLIPTTPKVTNERIE